MTKRRRPSTHREEVAERLKRVPELVALGLTLNQISFELNVTPRTVSRYKTKLGLVVPQNIMTPEEIEEAARMLDDGQSLAEVARTTGRPQGTLSHRLSGRSQWNSSMAQHWRWMNERLRAI